MTMMVRIRYIARTNLQEGFSEPFGVISYRGTIGEVADVPPEIAAVLVRDGNAVILEEKKPAAAKPAAPAAVQARKRKR